MDEIRAIGFDIAKNVFQLHGVGACRFAFNSEICRVWRRQMPFFALKGEMTTRFVRWYLMSRRDVGSKSGDRSG